jgi:hypothetical protein
MLSEKKTRELLHKFIGDVNRLKHSEKVAETGFEIAKKIKSLHPRIKLNVEEVKVLGLLHDIGRSEKLNKTGLHPLDGKNFLESLGEKELGRKISTHSIALETAELKGVQGDFEPKTLEEKILTYADMHVNHLGERVSFNERIKGIKERYQNHSKTMKAISKGLKRLKAIKEEIEGLLGQG